LLQFAGAGLLSLSLGGCIASGQVHSSAAVSAPNLVYINPNVQVIADYDEPIFYASNFYWRYDGGVWYRSSDYTRGWVRIQTTPVAIQQIESPSVYIHYHAQAAASAQTTPPHDQREAAHEQRDERKDVKAEQKEERQEAKAEQKEEHKEDKAEHKADHKEGKGPKGH
jgi:hypothetical protein